MTREVFRWIAFASTLSTLIPLVYLFIYRKSQPRQNVILAVSLFISLVFDVIGGTLAYYQITNVLSNNLYRIIALPAIMWFYHETLIKRSFKILVRIFTIGFLVVVLIFAVNQGLSVPNYEVMTLSSILITVTSLFFVGDLNLMDQSAFVNNRFHQTNIILNTSLALYYFVTIVLFAVTDYIFSHFTPEDIRLFWCFHNAAHVLKNAGITVAFYLSAKRSNVSY
jgi:hypothetical protein